MNKNIKVAKELVKLAKCLIAKELLQQVENVEDLQNPGQYYDYGNDEVALVIELDDDWMPVLANSRYQSRPDIEKEVKEWKKKVKFVELGSWEDQLSSLNERVCVIIVKKDSCLLK